MTDVIGNPEAALPDEAVRITSTRGTVRIDAPRLFGRDDTLFARMAERLLKVSAVDAVHIDRLAGTVTVNYGVSTLSPADALSRLAAALSGDGGCAEPESPAVLDLQLIGGAVTRIVRRRHFGARRPLAAAVVGFRSATSRITGLGRGRSKRRNGRAPDEVVMLAEFVVHYRPHPVVGAEAPAQLLTGAARRLDIAEGGRGPADGNGEHSPRRERVTIAAGLRRLANLSAASGCFVMSFVGLITPGIPTVPFVLATSYFLVRSSPALDNRLRRSRLFGQMVRDWQAYEGMRPSTKRKIVILTLAIMGVSILFVGSSLPLLVLVCGMGTLGTALILWTPTVAEDAPDDRSTLVIAEPAG